MSENNQLTNEQVDTMEDCLRTAQKMVEKAGAIVSTVGGIENSKVWGKLTTLANDIGDEICGLWMIRPER